MPSLWQTFNRCGNGNDDTMIIHLSDRSGNGDKNRIYSVPSDEEKRQYLFCSLEGLDIG